MKKLHQAALVAPRPATRPVGEETNTFMIRVCTSFELAEDGPARITTTSRTARCQSVPREIARLRIVDGRAHSPTLLAWQGGACRCDALGLGIEGVDRRGTRDGEGRQPTFAAADIENVLAVKADKVGDRSRLYSGFVALLHG